MRRFLCSLVAGVFFAAFAGGITPAPAPPPAPTIPLDTDGGSPPFVRGRVQGTQFWFLLDTASPSSFGRKQAQRLGLPDGSTLGELAIDPSGVTVTMPSLAVADLDPHQIALGHRLDGVLGSEFFARFVVLSDPGHAGLLGMDVLRRFRVTLDGACGRILVEKNSAFARPFDCDASGLLVQARGADLTTIEVRCVTPGSAGAQAGIEAGDLILAVDGRPVGEITPRGVRRLFRIDGKRYALSILRRGAIHQLQLRCRRQI